MRLHQTRNFAFAMTLICSPALTAEIGAASSAMAAWECRNDDVEVTCTDTDCVVASQHTPMSVSVNATEISACGYSTCWSGATMAVLSSGPFQIFSGTNLVSNMDAYETESVSVTIDTQTGAASILMPGLFVNPAICKSVTGTK